MDKKQHMALKQAIADAVWQREIDQMTTREVADAYSCPLGTARQILMAIAMGTSGDTRFVVVADEGGVRVADGSVFSYSSIDIDVSLGQISGDQRPKHYIWFAS